MSRSWYVSPVRVRPGHYIPGRYDSSDGYWMGPRPSNEFCKGDMEKVRGPFPNAKKAAEAARVWREVDGKHSDIWLCLVEGDYGEVTHCNKYDPDHQHTHNFLRGGKCSSCDERCPHPTFADDGFGYSCCLVCGCLKPLDGSPDFYELPLGKPEVCRLTSSNLGE